MKLFPKIMSELIVWVRINYVLTPSRTIMFIKCGSSELQNSVVLWKKKNSKTLNVTWLLFLINTINLLVYVQEREEINRIGRNNKKLKNKEINEESNIFIFQSGGYSTLRYSNIISLFN